MGCCNLGSMSHLLVLATGALSGGGCTEASSAQPAGGPEGRHQGVLQSEAPAGQRARCQPGSRNQLQSSSKYHYSYQPQVCLPPPPFQPPSQYPATDTLPPKPPQRYARRFCNTQPAEQHCHRDWQQACCERVCHLQQIMPQHHDASAAQAAHNIGATSSELLAA